jgi:hypothetical protein
MKNRPEMSSAALPGIGEDELILHYYGESADPGAIDKALAADAALARRYAELVRDLAAATVETPEPPADLSARVWQGIRPRLAPAVLADRSPGSGRPVPAGDRAGPLPPPRSRSSPRSPSAI